MLHGVVPILAMPFDDDGDIDHGALASEVDYLIGLGVDGVGTGIASESFALTESERDDATATIAKAADGRVPYIQSVGGDGTRIAADRARRARANGADAALVLPPLFMPFPPDALTGHYLTVGEQIPVMIQDANAHRGIEMPVDWLESMCRRPGIIGTKIEVEGGLDKIAVLAERLPAADIFGGAGGVAFREELRAGSTGTMPGPAGIEVFVATKRSIEAGRDGAEFDAIRPVLDWLFASLDLFIWAQKQVLVELGIIGSANMRQPTPVPSGAPEQVAKLVAQLRADA